MKRVTVTQLKNKLSEVLRLVRRGETVEVLDRSVPVARISAIEAPREGEDAVLARLVRDGIVTPARKKPSRGIWRRPPVRSTQDPVRALVEERGDR
ncbi:MAG: type II toxin-antitoxin system prevent-host-death family antitoxin [Planctomycetes bacterium]|nr:type II toxin-antitoxin system prevent-host-death family antitoxin [Planctomycetota bacterium]